MAVVPEGAQRSEDGYYWWDGGTWQPVPEDERGVTLDGGSQGTASGGGAGEVTKEELAQITSADQLDDRYLPFFEPDVDMYPDDDSDAVGEDVLDDEPAANATGSL